MCIISFHFQDHPNYKLIVAANRDEFYERPTKEAHFWGDKPNILAGRDLKALGTWLGITKDGRFAALTNYRDPKSESEDKKSRGEIVTSFLTSTKKAPDFLETLHQNSAEYNGFNILLGTPDELFYYGNRQNKIVKVSPGTHSISNHLMNTPWPKVSKARTNLQQYVQNHNIIDVEEIFLQLNDQEIAEDNLLPETGIDLDLERQLSPVFIKTEHYGTRASTVLLVTKDNHVTFIERTYNSGSFKKENKFNFDIKTSR